MADSTALRYAAFTDTPGGGNPASVVLEAAGMSDAQMQDLAARPGYSESAFLTARPRQPSAHTCACWRRSRRRWT